MSQIRSFLVYAVEMNTYYVTFGAGTILANYYQEFQAKDESIVRAWCNAYYLGLWAAVYNSQPSEFAKPLNEKPVQLFHQHADHIRKPYAYS